MELESRSSVFALANGREVSFWGRRLISYFLLSVLMANMSARNQTAPVRKPRSKLIISGRPLIRCGSAKSNAVQIKAIATETTFIGGSFTSAYNSYVPAAMFRPRISIAINPLHGVTLSPTALREGELCSARPSAITRSLRRPAKADI